MTSCTTWRTAMKSTYRITLLLFSLLLSLLLLPGCGETSSYTIDKVEIMADIMPDGDLYVEELYTYTVHGDYDWMPRHMDAYGGENIEFFEAYTPPSDRVLGDFGYVGLNRLNVDWNPRRGTYYVDFRAKNETWQLYYRYRIDKAAVKYADGGELDWTFLAQNRRGYIGVSRAAAGQRFQEDPNAQKGLPQFTFKGDRSRLDAADRHLLGWLFRGTSVLSLEHLAGPTKTERKQKA
ncbi:DUF2207 domain-containing protein [Paenibacillus sp. JMULE4]|nr:DUF2207 domain-containing protein [Paenibacillus sp. JMULE4]